MNIRMGQRLFGWLFQLFKRLGWLYALVLVVGLAALLGFAKLVDELFEPSELADINEAVLQFLHAHSSHGLDSAALFLSSIGGVIGSVVVALVVLGFFLYLKRPLDGAVLVLVLVGGTIFAFALKQFFRLPRPDLFESLAPESSFAFPSGHATVSACLYGYLAARLILDDSRASWRWGAAAGLLLIPIGVMWSRLYLGVHWPSDVIAGALIAAFWITVCLVIRHLALQFRGQGL